MEVLQSKAKLRERIDALVQDNRELRIAAKVREADLVEWGRVYNELCDRISVLERAVDAAAKMLRKRVGR